MKQYSGVAFITIIIRHLQISNVLLSSSAEFPEERDQFLHEKGHVVQGVKTNSVIQGILRNKDIITAITAPQLSDHFL